MKIIWVVLRNYKCYRATHVIYFWSSWFCGMIWDNWIWKSSILEALQYFFYWNKDFFSINKDAQVGISEWFVAPIFAVEENYINDKYNQITNIDISIRDQIDPKYTNIFIPWINWSWEYFLLETLSNWKSWRIIDETSTEAKGLTELIRSKYKYVYIPAEFPIDYLTQVQSEISESIIWKSLNRSLEQQIPEHIKTQINDILYAYTDEKIVTPLKEIDDRYNYKSLKWKTSRSNLTQKVLAEMLVEVYFKDRWIHFNDISIEDLSSWQRRRAYIDYITALIFSSEGEFCNNLILAIDEPEISCDAVARYTQFERLIQVQSKIGQLLITTHWYWWILQQKNWDVLLLSENPTTLIRSSDTYYTNEYPFKTDFEIPYDLRSCTDFLSSLGALAQRFSDKRYIICEGISDKIYLEASIISDQYRFIVWWDSTMVAKLYWFWKMQWRSFSEPNNVKFLVDTDPSREYDKWLYRIMKNQSLEYSITNIPVSGWANEIADIEDLLEMNEFINALRWVINSDSTVIPADVEFVNNLKITHTDYQWRASLWLSEVENIQLNNIYKSRKFKVSQVYSPNSENSFLKRIIDSLF